MRKNVIFERGEFKNLRKDLEKKYRYISQVVTVKYATFISENSSMKFRMQFEEINDPFDMDCFNSKDLDCVLLLMSFTKAKCLEDMKGKLLMSFVGINGDQLGFGSISKNKVVSIPYVPYKDDTEENMIANTESPSDEEWEQFCKSFGC